MKKNAIFEDKNKLDFIIEDITYLATLKTDLMQIEKIRRNTFIQIFGVHSFSFVNIVNT